PSVEGQALRFSSTPPLPAGLLLDSLTGEITGTPTAPSAAKNYTITAKNGAGMVTATLNITVIDIIVAPYELTYLHNPVNYLPGLPIPENVARVLGSNPRFSVDPPLPEGLKLDS